MQVRLSVAALATMCARPVAVVSWWTMQGNSSHWSNSILEMSTLLPANIDQSETSIQVTWSVWTNRRPVFCSNLPQSMISMSPLFLRSIVKADAEAARRARLRRVFMMTWLLWCIFTFENDKFSGLWGIFILHGAPYLRHDLLHSVLMDMDFVKDYKGYLNCSISEHISIKL